MAYTDADVDEAIERVAADVAQRFNQPEFHGPAMAALVEELRRMETARRAGDRAAAAVFATAAQPALERYRPTNATSRSRAVLGEIVAELLASAPSAEP